MPDLREQLHHCFQGRVRLMGLGNVDCGDDGFGVRLAEALKSEGRTEDRSHTYSDFGLRPSFGLRTSDFGFGGTVIVAGTVPERFIGRVADEGFDHVIFLDAVDFGGSPGSVVFLNSDEVTARFPQVSTHKLSLGLLARQVEANSHAKAWLLGVQPASLKPSQTLTPTAQTTLDLVLELLRACLRGSSRGNEALISPMRGLDKRENLSLVTSAAAKTTEVMA